VCKQLIAGLVLLLAVSALADQIVMKNGDRLTGSITKSDGKALVIHTDYAGDVTVKFDDIQSLTSTGDLNVTLGGKTAVGSVTTSGSNLVVATKAAGSVEAPIASVSAVRSPAEQAAYEKTVHPGFAEGWAGGVNIGFALTAGNSETKSLNIGATAVRTGLHDKLVLYENSIYAVTGKIGGVPQNPAQTTADSNGGGIRYDRDINPRTFGFVSGDFFSNSLQDLSLRSILGGGIGFHAIKHPNTTLDLLAGVNYTHESYSDVVDPNVTQPSTPPYITYSPSYSTANLSFGDTFMHKLGKSTTLNQTFLIYPGLSTTQIVVLEPTLPNSTKDVREYRGNFNLGLVTKLNKWLGWQFTFGDVFVSDPPTVPLGTPRIERNDVQLATGLNISFKH
jgi:putative salt-induced outer membrane protein YdiY